MILNMYMIRLIINQKLSYAQFVKKENKKRKYPYVFTCTVRHEEHKDNNISI